MNNKRKEVTEMLFQNNGAYWMNSILVMKLSNLHQELMQGLKSLWTQLFSPYDNHEGSQRWNGTSSRQEGPQRQNGTSPKDAPGVKEMSSAEKIVSQIIFRARGQSQFNAEQRSKSISSDIKTQIANENISKKDLLGVIKVNKNLFDFNSIKQLVEDGVFSIDDILNIDTQNELLTTVVDELKGIRGQTDNEPFPAPKGHFEVRRDCTEFYFWGVPSSGKTCALGAILKSVNFQGNKREFSMTVDSDSQGSTYGDALQSRISSNGISEFVPSTPTTSMYAMGYDFWSDGIIDRQICDHVNEVVHRVHPITLIDMAGELMKSFYRAGEENNNEIKEVKKSLNKVLRSNNYQIHIFIIDYGLHLRKFENVDYDRYLTNIVTYLDKNNIFSCKTRLICILVTKADECLCEHTERDEKIKEYVFSHFSNLYECIRRICYAKNINEKYKYEPLIIPFSVGEVVFQKFFKYNPEDSISFVKNIILKYSWSRSIRYNHLSRFLARILKHLGR